MDFGGPNCEELDTYPCQCPHNYHPQTICQGCVDRDVCRPPLKNQRGSFKSENQVLSKYIRGGHGGASCAISACHYRKT